MSYYPNRNFDREVVLDELQYAEDFISLSEQDKEILWAAALMHDVEKRSTSQDEGNGNISANGHARRGEYTARTILFQDVPAPFHIREQIASLVRFHGLPIWLLEKESLEKKILEVAMRVNTQHLAILSEVDACGRMCTDIKPLVDNIQLFREFCKEHECWRKAREFASVSARFHYFNTENSYVDYVPFENFKCEVIMMSGLPGMGKDH